MSENTTDPDDLDPKLAAPLYVLLTERNVTRAAAVLGVDQPKMSRSLAKLRRYFGDELLAPDRGGLSLTSIGESLIEPARRAVKAHRDIVAAGRRFDPATSTRLCRIISSDYCQLVLLHQLAEIMEQRAPGVTVRVTPVVGDFADRLRIGLADVLVVPTLLREDVPGLAHLDYEPLFRDEFVLAADKDNPDLAGRSHVTRDEFRDLRHLQYNAHDQLPSLIERRLQEFDLHERRTVWNCETFSEIPGMLARRRLVTVMHRRMAERFPHLRAWPLPLRDGEHQAPLIEAMFPAPTANSAQRWLCAMLRDSARQLPTLPSL